MTHCPLSGADGRDRLMRESIGALILVARRHHRLIEQQVDALGIHRSQHHMLMTLSRMGKTASQKEIADELGISPAAVARTLKTLEAEGYVEKVCGADGRRNEISILPAGQAKIEATRSLFCELDTGMFEGVSDGELAAMTAALRRILANIARMEPNGAPKGGEGPQ